jgi:hypothetical protein
MLGSDQYSHLLLKSYPHWDLYLSDKQWPHVGRCYAWWRDHPKRKGEGEGKPLSWLPLPAIIEYNVHIFNDVMHACQALGYSREYGKGFLLNVAYLANEQVHNHHLHVHYIPRSAVKFKVSDIELMVDDHAWGGDYSKHPAGSPMKPDDLLAIKVTMKSALERHGPRPA